jgi:two-component sensor histidine kinase/CheY-like chemotaxis protein
VTETRARVLYIDDDPGLARLVQKTLESRGFDVSLEASGMDGLRRLQQDRFDIVALDHHMPGQTGLDTLPQIRALPEAPPVVYVTGSEDSRVAVAALKAGAVDYVWKDVQGHFRDLLAEAVVTALEKERLRRDKEAAQREVIAARDRAELLLREVNHRVTNSLSIVAALTNLQRTTVTDSAALRALDEMQARILAIAGVHRRLYTSHDVQTVDMQPYLEGLVEELRSSMLAWGSDHDIQLSVEPVSVSTDKAVSLGIIVTELVTNAYKYAYASDGRGDIRVCMAREGEHVLLRVEDDGVGLPPASARPAGTGIGTRVIKSMSVRLGSDLIYEPVERGTRALLRFQL